MYVVAWEKGKSELIIYNFETKLPEESVKDKFFEGMHK